MGRKFKNYTQEQKDQVIELHLQGFSSRKICRTLGISEKRKSDINYMIKAWKEGRLTYSKSEISLESNMPKILVLDIETSTTLSEHFGTFKVNIGLDAIVRDWCVLSWAAKWWDQDEVMYEDIRDQFDGSAQSILNQPDDTELLRRMWHLLDEADIVVTQNGVRFDQKKLNARFIQKGFKPYRPVKHIDTLLIAKKHFGFTSNKLAYMTDKLCKQYKKLEHGNFAGMKLWLECMIGNLEAWDEMEVYNIHDVLSLQELTTVLAPWSNAIPNLDLYHTTEINMCLCGNDEWEHAGFSYTGLSKFDTFKCTDCGHHRRGRTNLHSKEKMKTLRMNVT